MDCNPAEIVPDQLALTCMHASSYWKAERGQRIAQFHSTTDRAGRTSKCRESAVAEQLDNTTAAALNAVTHSRVVALQQRPPLAVAEPGGARVESTMSVNKSVARARSTGVAGAPRSRSLQSPLQSSLGRRTRMRGRGRAAQRSGRSESALRAPDRPRLASSRPRGEERASVRGCSAGRCVRRCVPQPR